MTVALNDALSTFLGDGATTVFAFDFPVASADNIEVFLAGVLLSADEYTVSLDPKQITCDTAPANGVLGAIIRTSDVTQDIVYSRTNNSMNVAALAAQLDLIVTKLQEVDRDAGFAVKTDYNIAPPRISGTFTDGLVLKYENGVLIPGPNAGQLQTDVDAAAASAAAALISENNTAADAIATAADRVQTGLDRTQTGLDVISTSTDRAVVASDKGTVAGYKAAADADAVATAADRVAVAADKDTVATDKATVAADKATVAGYVSDAQSARDQTLSAFDSFDDRYLGSKVTAPTVDNDGEALVGGALYYSTTLGMQVWTGTEWVAAYVSGTSFYTKTESDARYATAAQGLLAASATQPGDLGNAASKNVGTTAGTVAAGDDARLASGKLEYCPVALGDETTPVSAGTGKISFRIPYAGTLTLVRASLVTAQASGSILTIDVNKNGVTMLSTKLTIDNTELTSKTAATAAVISVASVAEDDLITFDVDQIGNGTAKGLKATLFVTRT